jgi:pimeloyl-ACP methyl ester carboxylesterase
MILFRATALAACIALAFSLGAAFAADAAPAGAAPPSNLDRTLDVYAKPETLVDIGGRKLNLRCSGDGATTVVLEAGALADSMTWQKVQPKLATSMRVCSYDRAGYGFSDAGPLPRDLAADARDLHALVVAAKIATPFVLVGHSLGTNIARRYDQLYGNDVSAIVLVDPPPQRTSEFSKAWVDADNASRSGVIAFATACEAAAREGKLPASDGDLAKCIRPPNPAFTDALNAAQRAQKSKPPFWNTLISEMRMNATLFEEPVSPKESHGDKPLIVLVAGNAFADAPPDGKNAMTSRSRKPTGLSSRRRRAGSAATSRTRRTTCSSTSLMPSSRPCAMPPRRRRARRLCRALRRVRSRNALSWRPLTPASSRRRPGPSSAYADSFANAGSRLSPG